MFKFLKRAKNIISTDKFLKVSLLEISPYSSIDEYSSAILFLISFSQDKIETIMEFLSFCNGMRTKLIQSSITQENEKADANADDKQIIKPVNYLFIAGSIADYKNLFKFGNLSNDVLKEFKREISTQLNKDKFSDLIDDGILFDSDFTPHSEPTVINDDEVNNAKMHWFTDTSKVMKLLPKAIKLSDIIDVLSVIYCDSNGDELTISFRDFINKNNVSNSIESFFNNKYNILVGFNAYELQHVTEPLYARPEFDEDLMGDVDDEVADKIFTQSYDRFVGMADEEVVYETIDEEVTDSTALTDDDIKNNNKLKGEDQNGKKNS